MSEGEWRQPGKTLTSWLQYLSEAHFGPTLNTSFSVRQTDMAAAITPLSADQARERFRAAHKVRLITSQEEGRGFAKLPAGVYGFTYAPATETPLFVKHSFGAYEVHKLGDGTGRLIAFCSAADAARLNSGRPEAFEADVYPAAFQNATELITVPFAWIQNEVYKVVRRDGNPVTLRISTEG
jgi:hypothetical protein